MSWLALVLVFLSATVHAVWNLLAHSQKVNGTLLLRFHFITLVIGVIPVLILEGKADLFPSKVWLLLILSGLFQAFFFWFDDGLSSWQL